LLHHNFYEVLIMALFNGQPHTQEPSGELQRFCRELRHQLGVVAHSLHQAKQQEMSDTDRRIYFGVADYVLANARRVVEERC
jgi:hypothetical protein